MVSQREVESRCRESQSPELPLFYWLVVGTRAVESRWVVFQTTALTIWATAPKLFCIQIQNLKTIALRNSLHIGTPGEMGCAASPNDSLQAMENSHCNRVQQLMAIKWRKWQTHTATYGHLLLLSEEASHLECSLLELSISLRISFLSIELHFQFGACVAGIYSAVSLLMLFLCDQAWDQASSSLLGENQLSPYQGWLRVLESNQPHQSQSLRYIATNTNPQYSSTQF